MFYIFLLSTDQNTGGLSIIHQSAPEDKAVVTNDKNKKLKQEHKNKNGVIDMKKWQSEPKAALDLPLWVTSEMT